MERLKSMKEAFVAQVQSQLGNLANVDAHELGEVVDMIKDMEEALYYCTITKAMEEKEHEGKGAHNTYYYTTNYKQEPMYFRDMDRDYGRMYYNGNGQSGGGNSGGNSGGGTRNYPWGDDMMYYGGGQGGTRYASGGQGGSNSSGNSGGDGNRGGGTRGYGGYGPSYEIEIPAEMMRDEREGKSGKTRRTYMENKQMHTDKAAQLKELEKYVLNE